MEPPPAVAPSLRCGICQSPVEAVEASTSCPDCRASYHPDCWEENGGCASYGCPGVPPTEARTGLEVPPAYWGQETKACPACGQTIQAAAIRCRACGATFESGGPQDRQEFARRRALAAARPGLQRTAIALFVLCLLPCTAPLAALVGVVWYLGHRRELAGLPALYPGLVRIGLGVGLGQTAWIVGVVVVYALFHGR